VLAPQIKGELTKEDVRRLVLETKDREHLSWEEIGKAGGRNPVGAAILLYGYGAATEQEANTLLTLLDLPKEAKGALMKVPHRTPYRPWPPTDPFIYRFYELVMLYGPALKDVAHEIFGDGIVSAIDMSLDLKKVVEDGVNRAVFTFNGKWLTYKKF
jgi:cyanate lyase